jgi:hypothetical protein
MGIRRIRLAAPLCKSVFSLGESGFESLGAHQLCALSPTAEAPDLSSGQSEFESQRAHYTHRFSWERTSAPTRMDGVRIVGGVPTYYGRGIEGVERLTWNSNSNLQNKFDNDMLKGLGLNFSANRNPFRDRAKSDADSRRRQSHAQSPRSEGQRSDGQRSEVRSLSLNSITEEFRPSGSKDSEGLFIFGIDFGVRFRALGKWLNPPDLGSGDFPVRVRGARPFCRTARPDL